MRGAVARAIRRARLQEAGSVSPCYEFATQKIGVVVARTRPWIVVLKNYLP